MSKIKTVEIKWFVPETPKTYKPNIQGDTIWYQHPWVLDANRRGKMIRRGLAKIEDNERLTVQAELGRLLAVKPKFRTDAPEGVRQEILDQYFEHLNDALKIPDEVYEDGLGPPAVISNEAKKKIRKLEIRVVELEAENAKLKRNIDALSNATGTVLEVEKTKTLAECLEHFEKRFTCREGAKASQRDRVIREVKKVLEAKRASISGSRRPPTISESMSKSEKPIVANMAMMILHWKHIPASLTGRQDGHGTTVRSQTTFYGIGSTRVDH